MVASRAPGSPRRSLRWVCAEPVLGVTGFDLAVHSCARNTLYRRTRRKRAPWKNSVPYTLVGRDRDVTRGALRRRIHFLGRNGVVRAGGAEVLAGKPVSSLRSTTSTEPSAPRSAARRIRRAPSGGTVTGRSSCTPERRRRRFRARRRPGPSPRDRSRPASAPRRRARGRRGTGLSHARDRRRRRARCPGTRAAASRGSGGTAGRAARARRWRQAEPSARDYRGRERGSAHETLEHAHALLTVIASTPARASASIVPSRSPIPTPAQTDHARSRQRQSGSRRARSGPASPSHSFAVA